MTSGFNRPSVRASARVLAALWMVLLAGCAPGAGASPSNAGPGSADPRDAALLYAQCMRANGVPDFPDPDANGQLRGAGHEQQDDPTFLAALDTCRALAPGAEHEQTDPATVEQMRAFSQCMRDNGLPDFPDPDAEGRLRGIGHEAGGPIYDAALEACRAKLPGGGEH